MAGMRQLALADLGAELADQGEVALEDLGDAGLDPLGLVGEVAGDADPQAVEVGARGQLDPRLDPDAGRVARVGALHLAQQQGGVGDVAGQWPALVERGGEGDHAVARDRPVGRLQPDDPAERRRLADRAARVGADRPRGQAAGDRRGRAAGGAAGYAIAVPRVSHRPVGGVLVRGAHRELVHVGLAQQPRPGLGEAPDRRRRVGRAIALEDPRSRRGLDPLGAEDVLDGDRHARATGSPPPPLAPASARHR